MNVECNVIFGIFVNKFVQYRNFVIRVLVPFIQTYFVCRQTSLASRLSFHLPMSTNYRSSVNNNLAEQMRSTFLPKQEMMK